MGVGGTVFGADVGDVERKIHESEIEFKTEGIARSMVKGRGDRLKRRSMQPGRRLPAAVHDGLVIHGGRRVVKVESNVVFACPDDLDRFAEFLRKNLGKPVKVIWT